MTIENQDKLSETPDPETSLHPQLSNMTFTANAVSIHETSTTDSRVNVDGFGSEECPSARLGRQLEI